MSFFFVIEFPLFPPIQNPPLFFFQILIKSPPVLLSNPPSILFIILYLIKVVFPLLKIFKPEILRQMSHCN